MRSTSSEGGALSFVGQSIAPTLNAAKGSAERDLLAASRQFLINYKKLTPIVYTSAAASGILLTIRYLIEPRRRRGTVSAIWDDILTEFGKAKDIDLAYHTVRGFNNTIEGKIVGTAEVTD